MDYMQVDLKLEPKQPFDDVLAALLAEIGYESFMNTNQGLMAYIPKGQFDQAQLDDVIQDLGGLQAEYQIEEIAHSNWNAAWEQDYKPVEVSKACVIRALFHNPMPDYDYEIIIQPQMSFGTGHHPTTLTMMQVLLGLELKGKTLMDIGTGTGVLAILAEKMGARAIRAFDIEDYIVDNARENVRHNNCVEIAVDKGDLAVNSAVEYDFILANINLNTLVSGLENIASQTRVGGQVLLSGFYESDVPHLISKAKDVGLIHTDTKTHQAWAVLLLDYQPDQ